MNYETRALFLGAVFSGISSLSHGATPAAPPVSATPGGALIGGYQRLTIPESGISLEQAIRISVDELVINGTLVTNGFPLAIDTRRVVFGPAGKIVSYVKPASSGLDGQVGANGENGSSASGRGAQGGRGHSGKPGRPGAAGVPGAPDPGRILLFAAASEGVIQIDGSGQAGGKGGKGGRGGKGGPGGKGGKGEVNCLASDRVGGTGGTGGDGGQGGVGGDGGHGGNGAPVRVLLGFPTTRLPTLVSAGGISGEAGDPGEGGDGGAGGPGGDGDAAKCAGFIKDTVDGGPSGSSGHFGPKGPEKAAPGLPGSSGEVLERVFPELEELRFRVHQEFYGFHEARMLYLLFQKSLGLTLADDVLRKRLSTLLEKMSNGSSSSKDVAARNQQLAQLLVEMRRRPALEIAKAWEHQFIRPAEAGLAAYEATRDPAVTARIRSAITYAREVVSLLNRIEESAQSTAASTQAAAQRITELMSFGRSFMEDDLNRALIACEEFNSRKASFSTEYTEQILGSTAHYLILACDGNPDFSDPANAFQEIPLTASASTGVPEFLRGMVEAVVPAYSQKVSRMLSPWDRIIAFAIGFLPLAYAEEEDPSVIIVGTQPIPAQALDAARPAEVPALSNGIIAGYRVPEENMDEVALATNLRVLSHWIGGAR